ncbi:MAG: tRNA (N6-threonylcarbamoyladenosine(37)-N6)-methyltransferase TrmO [Chloroflexi bacterium]|nr:tRNA (N6-threonylcarbamoyladenosine(37)-N6)-methyltransferase TrmO [Chloroflexota bacterium]
MEITYHPIGVIHSPFTDLKQMPIQPTGRSSAPGTVEVFSEFAEGLKDLGGFSHLILVYHFHQSRQVTLTVTPFLDSAPRGLFATRAPTRPNPIGISIIELVSIKANILQIANLDILDGTPLLDIKPYVPDFDRPAAARVGWLEETRQNLKSTHSDVRFVSG